MKPQVNAIAGRLSLRQPQRRSLEILDRITEIVPPRKGADIAAALAVIQPEKREEMTAADVMAKKDAAVKWCKRASDHAKTYGGKPWKYVLIPHDVVAENVTLEWLASSTE